MGNLCSSGSDRSEKKEDPQLRDKPKDGEDEALLPKSGIEVNASGEGVDVSVGQKAGGDDDGGGFGGFMSDVVTSGESAIADATKSLDEEGDKIVASGRGTLEQAVDSGNILGAKEVDEVQVKATSAFTEAAASAKTAAEDAVAQGVEAVQQKVEEGYQVAAGKIDVVVQQGQEKVVAVVESAKYGVVGAFNSAESGSESLQKEVQTARDNVDQPAAAGVQDASNIAESASTVVTANVQSAKNDAVFGVEAVHSEAANLKGEAENSVAANVRAVEETVTSSVAAAQESVSHGVKEQVLDKLEDLETSAAELAGTAKQTADRQIDEVVGSAKTAASEAAENVDQTVGAARDSVSGVAESAYDEYDQLPSSAFTRVHFAEDATSHLEKDTAGSLSSPAATAADSIENELTSAEQGVGTVRQGWESVENFENEVKEASSGDVADDVAGEPEKDQSSGYFDGFQSAAKAAALSGAEYVKEQVVGKVQSLVGGHQEETAEEQPAAEETQQQDPSSASSALVESEDNFLDKAKSLLEAHRNSLDAGKPASPGVRFSIDLEEQSSEADNENSPGNAESQAEIDATTEATARDFVESIIEKATSLVSESLGQSDPANDNDLSSSSEPSIDRGEETLAPKKRGVMFVSPQLSEKSSSLSSPQDFSPPPPPPESDLSPPGESTNSSISQGDLIERDELLLPPPPPVDNTTNENNNNSSNIINNNMEDDESIQRVAMEVTAKAVQDAIKIVTENGTGPVVNTSSFSNDMGISSPSSAETEEAEEEEEMTTTDSSQVERGSSVSDLTDTSAPGSVAGSLSSYDPGAVFRQDIANMSDLALSPIDSAARSVDEVRSAKTTGDLINLEDVLGSVAETPTPTSTATFDVYPPPPPPPESGEDLQNSYTNPPPPPPFSEVPSSLPPFDEISSSPCKPTIIINSPDSAHHTNGSTEDVSSPQTEALI